MTAFAHICLILWAGASPVCWHDEQPVLQGFDTEQECYEGVDDFMKEIKRRGLSGISLTWRCGDQT